MKRSCYALTWLMGSIIGGLLIVGGASGQIPPRAPSLDQSPRTEAECPAIPPSAIRLPATVSGDGPADEDSGFSDQTDNDFGADQAGFFVFRAEFESLPFSVLGFADGALDVPERDEVSGLSESSCCPPSHVAPISVPGLEDGRSLTVIPDTASGGRLAVGAGEAFAGHDFDSQELVAQHVAAEKRISSAELLRGLARSLIASGEWLQGAAEGLETTTTEVDE